MKSDVRMPADWEPHAACWTAWPASDVAWGKHLHRAQRQFVTFLETITAGEGSERIELLVADEPGEEQAREALQQLGDKVRYRRIVYGDVWLRDTGPLFLVSSRGVKAVRFAFNGWGGRYLYPNDTKVAQAIAKARKLKAKSDDLVLEGGALETDGAGTCITTRSVLLNENRNPGLDEAAVEKRLAKVLSMEHVIWLEMGLAYDHTDGHVDNLARFVAPGVVMHMMSASADDPNQETLAKIRKTLGEAQDAKGRPLDLLTVPSPGRVIGVRGNVMAASYLNFYVGNETVVVPAFGSRMDKAARDLIAAHFEDREVVSLDTRALLEGGGSFHCITQPEPQIP